MYEWIIPNFRNNLDLLTTYFDNRAEIKIIKQPNLQGLQILEGLKTKLKEDTHRTKNIGPNRRSKTKNRKIYTMATKQTI